MLKADDFIQKPFSTRELVARIRSVLRLSGASCRLPSHEQYYALSRSERGFRHKHSDHRRRSADADPNGIPDTGYVSAPPQPVFERSEIQHEAWEEDGISERAVDTNISRLRKNWANMGVT